MPILKPCAVCGTLSLKARCPRHAQRYTHAERQRMVRAVETWRMTHGDLCPGYGREPHPASDLTADHEVPVMRGGTGGRLAVLCRSCNARRSASAS